MWCCGLLILFVCVMQVYPLSIPDVLLFEPAVHGDQRGYFLESFRQDLLEQHIGQVRFVQDNESKSTRGVLRGLHFQRPPFTQSKLVRVVQGCVLDVAVDLRRGSPWYGQYVACELDDQLKRMLWVPKGFAHGFVVLSEEAVFAYKCDNYYAPDYDAGVRWNDPQLDIHWQIPASQIQVSGKDAGLPLFSSVNCFDYTDLRDIYGQGGL